VGEADQDNAQGEVDFGEPRRRPKALFGTINTARRYHPRLSTDRDEEDKRHKETEQDRRAIHLTWKDYLALSIAALETVLAPLVIVAVIILIVAIWVTGHF
jgi:hypothetical protein